MPDIQELQERIIPFFPKRIRGDLQADLKSGTARKISQGIVWTFFSAVVFRSIVFLTSVCVARMLNREGFGEFGMVRATIDMFVAFAGFGLGMTTTKFIAQHKVNDKVKAGRIIKLSAMVSWVVGFLIAMVMISAAEVLAIRSLQAPALANDLRIGALAIFFYSINSAQNGTLAGFEAFKNFARINMIAGTVNFPVSIALVWYLGVEGAVIGLATNALMVAVLGFFEVRKVAARYGVNVNERGALKEFKVLTQFSLPAVMGNMLILPVTWLCNAILIKQPEGFKELGIYNAGLSIMLIANVVNGMLGQVLLPYAVQNFEKKSKKFEMLNCMLPWAIGIFIALPCMFVPEAGDVLFGKSFSGHELHITIMIIMISTIVISHRQGIVRNFAAGSHMWWNMFSNTCWGVIALVTMYLLRDEGAAGRAGAFGIAYVLSTLLFLPFYYRKKLCDHDFIASPESIAIWALVFASFFLLYFVTVESILLRLTLMIAVLATILVLLTRFYRKYV
ncbi:oligosaccharide flippase family protein [Chitinophaga japonensis]|uniref:O-antigen/teichoic acid export membrane protein n=1 Tax=Chitinophaga japonensis TaxID=104662 RepID=A0A562T131_CHIJA|nr:oligosaccharide flippase family protein [Chitinophaga japonensis]TWI86938.1 O-antigen/teichoic acid export membrane protein [Chitinophaga japonensis]